MFTKSSFRDYQAIPALDKYDADELDESEYDAISISERREAERAMRKRDQEMGGGDMRRGLFYGNSFSSFTTNFSVITYVVKLFK